MRGLLPRLELPRQGVFRTTRWKARLSRPSLARKRGDLTRRQTDMLDLGAEERRLRMPSSQPLREILLQGALR